MIKNRCILWSHANAFLGATTNYAKHLQLTASSLPALHLSHVTSHKNNLLR